MIKLTVTEWTTTLTKFMSELLHKIVDHHGGIAAAAVPGFLTAGSQIDIDTVMKQWSYCDSLALRMYQVKNTMVAMWWG